MYSYQTQRFAHNNNDTLNDEKSQLKNPPPPTKNPAVDTTHTPDLPSRELEPPVDARADLDIVRLVLGRDDAVADEEVEQDYTNHTHISSSSTPIEI